MRWHAAKRAAASSTWPANVQCVGHPSRGGRRLHGATLGAVAEEERGHVESAGDEPGERLDDEALEAVEGARVHEAERGRRSGHALAERVVGQAVRDDGDSPGGDARRLQALRDGARDGEVARGGTVLEARQRAPAGRKDDAAVDDERYGGGGAGEDRGAVAAGVAGVDDPGAERPRLARDRDEHAGEASEPAGISAVSIPAARAAGASGPPRRARSRRTCPRAARPARRSADWRCPPRIPGPRSSASSLTAGQDSALLMFCPCARRSPSSSSRRTRRTACRRRSRPLRSRKTSSSRTRGPPTGPQRPYASRARGSCRSGGTASWARATGRSPSHATTGSSCSTRTSASRRSCARRSFPSSRPTTPKSPAVACHVSRISSTARSGTGAGTRTSSCASGAAHAACRAEGGRVHEALAVDGPVGRLASPLVHYPYRDLSDAVRKASRYAQLGAEDRYDRGARGSAAGLFLRPAFEFLRCLVLKRGFLDGAVGWSVAFLHASSYFLRAAFLLEFERRPGADGRRGS